MADKVKLANLLCKAHNAVTEADMEDNLSYAAALGIEADILIANGVTIPVRCDECKWYGVDSTKGGFCALTASPSMWTDGITQLEPNDFCSRGERKDDV